MKRHAWLTVGLGLSLVLGACSDDEGGGQGTVDGGEDLSAQIKDLNDQLDKLGTDQMNLGGRITALETPKDPAMCSAGELCIPDGISFSRMGMDPIIQALCMRETSCCSAGELNYFYGPGIKNAADCVAAFTDIVNNGISESNPTFTQHLDLVVRVAHAINDTNVRMSLSAEGIAACAASITAEACPGAVDEAERCKPAAVAPCSLEALVKGLEGEGDTCDPQSGVPECGAGLVCRGGFGSGAAQSGICAPKAAVGERCTSQADCDDLSCNFATGLCQERAKENDACAYVDPSFARVDPWYGVYVYSSEYGDGRYVSLAATSLDCDDGLACNPVSKTCVKDHCATGAFCKTNSECPTGNVCTRANDSALLSLAPPHPFYGVRVGVCAPALADGAACDPVMNECISQNCDDVAVVGEFKCQPTPAADGSACTVAANCASNHCGSDLKCSPVCDTPSSACEGAECRTCAAGFYCMPYAGTVGHCETLLADGRACEGSVDTARRALSCASGYCNAIGQCGPKVAANGTCTAGHHAQCQGGQYCNVTTCTTTTALLAECTTAGECGPYGTCWDVDGPALSGTVKRCYEGDGVDTANMPNGVYCTSNSQCESTWCRNNGTTSVCTKLPDDGAACDLDNTAANRCGLESFCAVVKDTRAGTCKKRGTVGDPCEIRFNGSDCAGGSGSCELVHETFLCDASSLPEDKTSCHPSQLL